jgi:hypothetical protein
MNAPPRGPLHPQEAAYLNQLIQRAKLAGQDDVLATLNPGNGMSRWMQGIPFVQTPVYEPMPWLAVDDHIGTEILDQVVSLTTPTANQVSSTVISFDVPSTVYAITAGCYDTAGAFDTNFTNSLDAFRIQCRTTNGQLFQTAAALGSSVCGTAERPRKLGGACWRFNTGGSLVVDITPLVSDLAIDVTFWTIRQPGPTNLTTG